MKASKGVSSSTASGYEPQAKKRQRLLIDADRAEEYIKTTQPGRVPLHQVTWYHDNRGGQGIMPFHVHTIAENICVEGTSSRRYGQVRLVEVPEKEKQALLAGNRKKAKQNPLLADFRAMSTTGPLYATLSCTHFVEAQKLFKEGARTYHNQPDGQKFILKDDDKEGQMIQSHGVTVVVYSADLWYDTPALLAIMREDNFDAQVSKHPRRRP